MNIVESLPNKPALTHLDDWHFDQEFATTALLRQFETQNLKGFGLELDQIGVIAAGALLHYVSETQKGALAHVKEFECVGS